MAQRGRKSAANLALASLTGTGNRLAPPSILTVAQQSEWFALVGAKSADWFGAEHSGLIAQYCRHRIQSDLIAQQLERFDPAWLTDDDGLKRFDQLAAMQERESRTITALLRTMRLTQQCQIRADKALRVNRAPKPWQA